jgi:hypothetical protein
VETLSTLRKWVRFNFEVKMRKILVIVLVSVLAVSCAGKAAKIYVSADSAAVNSLLRFQSEKNVRCDAGQIPASTCEAVAKAFVPVWEAYLEVNALVSSEAPLPQIDVAIANFKAAGLKFKDALQNVQGNYRDLLLDLLEQALRKFDSR